MNQSMTAGKQRFRPEWRVLAIVVTVLVPAWVLVLSVLAIGGAGWHEVLGSTFLFSGLALAWTLTVFKLKRKNPKYVEAMLDDGNDPK